MWPSITIISISKRPKLNKMDLAYKEQDVEVKLAYLTWLSSTPLLVTDDGIRHISSTFLGRGWGTIPRGMCDGRVIHNP